MVNECWKVSLIISYHRFLNICRTRTSFLPFSEEKHMKLKQVKFSLIKHKNKNLFLFLIGEIDTRKIPLKETFLQIFKMQYRISANNEFACNTSQYNSYSKQFSCIAECIDRKQVTVGLTKLTLNFAFARAKNRL